MKSILRKMINCLFGATGAEKECFGHRISNHGTCARCGCSRAYIRHTQCKCQGVQKKEEVRNLVVALGTCDAVIYDDEVAIGLSMYGMNELPSIVFKSSGLEAACAIEMCIGLKVMLVEDGRAFFIYSKYKEDDRPALPMMIELQKQILRWRAEGGFAIAPGETQLSEGT